MEYIICFGLVIVLIGLIYYIHLNNTKIEKNCITLYEDNLPENFNGLRIVHISDFHNVIYQDNNRHLLNDIASLKPDYIFFTGDIVDSRRLNLDVVKAFSEELCKIAPVYFVTGNHEGRFPIETYHQFLNDLTHLGMTIVNQRKVTIKKGEQRINIIGLEDPRIHSDDHNAALDCRLLKEQLESLDINENDFNLLLSHRPEKFNLYCDYPIDVVFSGHAHGGQIRLPLIGPLYAPNQGLFPKYTAGIYSNGKTKMIVNRGVGPSRFPIRFNNHPEIILVKLYRQ